MKRRLPSFEELSILATLSLICTAIVCVMPKADLALAVLAVPLFVTSAVMGMRRCPLYAPVRHEVRVQTRETSTEV